MDATVGAGTVTKTPRQQLRSDCVHTVAPVFACLSLPARSTMFSLPTRMWFSPSAPICPQALDNNDNNSSNQSSGKLRIKDDSKNHNGILYPENTTHNNNYSIYRALWETQSTLQLKKNTLHINPYKQINGLGALKIHTNHSGPHTHRHDHVHVIN